MKRILVCLTVALGLCFVATTASAQDGEDDVKTKFYDFDDMLIDGDIKKPDGAMFGTIEAAKFKRLLSLKKSFLPKIQDTAKADALK